MITSGLIIIGGIALEGYRRFRKKNTTNSPVDKASDKIQHLSSQKKIIEAPEIKNEISSEEQAINRKSKLFISSFCMTGIATLINPSLAILNLPMALYILRDVYRGSYKSLIKKKLNVDTLVATINTILLLKGMYLMNNIYLMLYLLNRKLMLKLKHQSENSIIDIFKQQPRTVWIITNNVETEVSFDSIKKGDIVVVNSGGKIPIDGTIAQGVATVDQHLLTGESQPAEKAKDDQVFAMTIVLSGRIEISVDKAGDQTTASQIVKILNETVNTKTEQELWSEKITNRSVLPMFLLTGASLPFLGSVGSLIILNSHFRYRLNIITAASVLNFLNLAAKKGILIKAGQTLEQVNHIDTVVFDKTGTLTIEQPIVGKIYCELYDENTVLSYAAAAEEKQSHPIAKAILEEVKHRELNTPTLDQSEYHVGYGIIVFINGHKIHIGSERFMRMENCIVSSSIQQAQEACHAEGRSLVMVAEDNQVIGAIELIITARPEAAMIIEALHQSGISVCIISGDQDGPTKALARQLNIDHYYAEVLPEKKADLIAELQQQGRSICYVGDGINDSIALKQANVSVSLSGASSIAVDSAQVILMDGTLNQLTELFQLAKDSKDNIKLISKGVIIPCAVNFAGAFFPAFTLLDSMALSVVSIGAGFSGATLPLLNYKKTEEPLDK